MKNTSDTLLKDALAIIDAGINSVKVDHLLHDRDLGDITGSSNILILAVGKAALAMARSVKRRLLAEGVEESNIELDVTIPHEYLVINDLGLIRKAGHPKPDYRSSEAAAGVRSRLNLLGKNEHVICLISGGGSALWSEPIQEITLEELQRTVSILLSAGLNIHEMNSIRSRLTTTGAGKLARSLAPASSQILLLSDVAGDDPSVIASGPFYRPGSIEFTRSVVESHGLKDKLPKSVIEFLSQIEDEDLPQVYPPHQIIGSNDIATRGMSDLAREYGYTVLAENLRGEASEMGRFIVSKVQDLEAGKHCIVLGGETHVTVNGDGEGGRNQELVLAAAIALQDSDRPIVIASAGTDGIDGFSDAAGAWADPTTLSRAREMGLDAKHYLDNNDSHNFFRRVGAQIITGPTHTNVMDIAVALVDN